MAIPEFQSLMLPLLKITGDGKEHSTSEVIETLAQQFGLGEIDRNEMLPSGKQRKFDNRVGWTKISQSSLKVWSSIYWLQWAMVALEKTLVKPLVRLEMGELMALSKKISLASMRSICKQSGGKERLEAPSCRGL